MHKIQCLVFLIFSFIHHGFAEEWTVKNGDIDVIGNHISFLTDENRELSVNDAIQKLFNDEFIQKNTSVFTSKNVTGYAWFSFSLSSEIKEEL